MAIIKKPTLEKQVAKLYWAHYRRAQNSYAGGENTMRVLTGGPAAGTITKLLYVTQWHKGHKNTGANLDVTVTVQPTWDRSVQVRGLSVVDGLLTTHAGRVVRQGDVDTYPCTWLRRGNGLAVRAESGWIARDRATGATYHLVGGTSAKAAAALRRKAKIQAGTAERRARLARLVDQLARQDVSEYGAVEVTRADSLRAGNCVPGTDEFINTCFPNRKSATIAEISAAVGRVDVITLSEAKLTLARQIGAACLAAIRRTKQLQRLDTVAVA